MHRQNLVLRSEQDSSSPYRLNGHISAKFVSNFVLDPHWVVGMGLPMQSQNTPSSRWKTIDRIVEPPPPPQAKPAQREGDVAGASAPEKKPTPPKWRNLTLDELRAWLEEAKRRQRIAKQNRERSVIPDSATPDFDQTNQQAQEEI